MNSVTPAMPLSARVLCDLKPALDGYAGIPQESRLLFRGLKELDLLQVEGLIQHGARRLRAALRAHGKPVVGAKRIDRLSRFVVSMYERPYASALDTLIGAVENSFARQLLRLRAHAGITLKPSVFESELFEDFVWRTFFSKTLSVADKPALAGSRFRVLSTPRKQLQQAGLAGLKYSDTPSFPTIDTRGFDYFLTQTPYPGRVKRGTTMIVRYHDAVPVLMPHTISDKAFHQASHFQSLKDNLRSGAWFSCISTATRRDLVRIFPEAEARSSVIYNIVSDEYFKSNTSPGVVQQIVRNRLGESPDFKAKLPAALLELAPLDAASCPPYVLMVSTIEPRKNHQLLLQAWERLKYTDFPQLKIVFVGSTGWDHAPVLKAFRPWAERGELFWLNNVPSSELRVLYEHAAVTVCPGLAEGFDYSGVEAMRCGGVVAASDIPVHREIFGQGSAYFDPYDPEAAAACIKRLLASDAAPLRDELVRHGLRVADLYSKSQIMPQWEAFFRERLALRAPR